MASLLIVDNNVMSLTPTCFFLNDSFQSALATPVLVPPAAPPPPPVGSEAEAPDLAVFFPALLEMAYGCCGSGSFNVNRG